MLIGILSDTHDRTDPLAAAIQRLRDRGAEHYIHCGDVGGERVLDLFAGLPFTFVWGNNDWDVTSLEDYAKSLGLTCGNRFADLTLGGKRFAVMHGDDAVVRRKALKDGIYDYLLEGHTHYYKDERVDRTRTINPGALFRANPKTVALLDTVTDRLERMVVG